MKFSMLLVLALTCVMSFLANTANAKTRVRHKSAQPPVEVYIDATGIPSSRVSILEAALQIAAPGKAIECAALGGSEERCGTGYDHAPFQEDGFECYTKNFRHGVFFDCGRSIAGEPLYRVELRANGQVKFNNFWAPTSNHSERYR